MVVFQFFQEYENLNLKNNRIFKKSMNFKIYNKHIFYQNGI